MKTLFIFFITAMLMNSCQNKSANTEVKNEQVKTTDTTAATTPTPAGESTSDHSTKLQGKWVSLDDPKSIMEFQGTTQRDVYDKEKVSEQTFRISGDTLETTDNSTSDKMQYLIEDLTDERLDLIYLARGNTLRYKKVK